MCIERANEQNGKLELFIDEIALLILLKLINEFYQCEGVGIWYKEVRNIIINYICFIFLMFLKAGKQEWKAEPYSIWFYP